MKLNAGHDGTVFKTRYKISLIVFDVLKPILAYLKFNIFDVI